MCERWQNQQEAMEFAIAHPSCMLNMDMGTGKTRVAIDTIFALPSTRRILVVCPKAVVPVWRENLTKFAPEGRWACWDKATGSVKAKKEDLEKWLHSVTGSVKQFVVMNYDCVWRDPMGDFIRKHFFDTVILDESHRAKAAGSKVSKYLALLGKYTQRKMCLSGTPMANSPLDVYGQYRFLDPTIFGTNHARFLQEYAVMGGPELRFIVGFKNQKRLNEKFASIAYTCKMSDVAGRLKLPEALPPISKYVQLPSKDLRTMKELNKEFVAECGTGHVVVNNVIVKLVRLQQITSGFCITKESVFDNEQEQELNMAKEDMLSEILQDLDPKENVVVFCIFKHDLEAIRRAARTNDRKDFELSGAENTLDDWKKSEGGVIAVQIQAGSEGVDMTKANHAVYFSMPHSLAMYEQSKARLYRPGQTRPVSFLHLIAENTIDESLYRSLVRKKDIIEAIKDGTFDFGYIHR
jgi:SNF2 family DNA or RNA helicase